MAQSGYTPISLYYSATSGHIPVAANLVPGELAFNIVDAKLYYLNTSGVVTLLQTGGGSGTSGYSGFSGFSGYSGIGTSGFSGYSGFSGTNGATGASGTSGYSGISGFSGYSGSGISGYSGSGISGYSGYSGLGLSGYSGPSGFSGYSGPSGYSGYSGGVGATGISGYSGFSGFSGATGTSGYSGNNGATGPIGNSGYSGISGYSGFSGTNGTAGGTGTSGYSGFSGATGTSGYSGINGATGPAGNSGYSGISGYSGFSGTNGASGYSGQSGTSGYSGSGTSGFSGYSGYSGATSYTATNLSGGYVNATSIQYSTTLTGGTGIVNLGSGQFYKDASGNVSIGYASGVAPLYVRGGNSNNLLVDNGGQQYTTISLYNNGTEKGQWFWDNTNSLLVFGTDVNAPVVVKTATVERMRVTGTGGVAIGTATDPGAGNLLVNGYVRGNLYGGGTNQFIYQSAANTTTFLAAPTAANQVISYNGSSVAWAAPISAVASGVVYENGQTINSNYTMTTGNNGMSAGPITVATGVTVTIPTGSRWSIV
jgi:hypothetical protein